jgi:vancomycin aglycone glucosyltransferase
VNKRVLISAVGTRGDVQPALALALEARALGCDVRLCVPPNFVEWAGRLGFDAAPIGIEMRAPRPGGPAAPRVVPDLIADQFVTVQRAADGCDVIVGAGVHQYAVRSIAERHGIPCVVAAYAPVSLPSVDLAPPGAIGETDSPPAIEQSWADARRSWNERSLQRVNANRERIGLAPVDDVLSHILGDRAWLAADATLGPAPSTPGMTVYQTGAWLLADPSALPSAVEAFLDAGQPPIYVGLGSMPAPAGTSHTLIAAARAVGRRVILSQGWADLGAIDDAADCLAIGDVNQQALFPRVAAVVHHGGAGTTTAAALAGVPQVAIPMFSDQFYWARRLRELGIGASVAFTGLSAEPLTEALSSALERTVTETATDVSGRVARDGARVAAEALESI